MGRQMETTNSKHLEISNTLIAAALDMPAIIDIPEVAKVKPDDVYPGLQLVWSKILDLHRDNNVSVTSLVASLQDATYDIYYFNQLRERYRDVNIDDLIGIGFALSNHSAKSRLKTDAGWLASQAYNGGKANEIAAEMIKRLTPIALQNHHDFTPIREVLREVYDDIERRSKNPSMIWGIPYKYYPYLGKVTGGKQKGEVTLFAGEPKVGKSWWVDQDAMGTALDGTPTAIWCGEMKKKQITRRMLQLQGLDGRRSKTGYMTIDDWTVLNEAVETLEKMPLYLEDKSIHVNDIYPIFSKMKNEYGIEHFVLDYAFLIGAEGNTETEKTQIVSREVKRATQEVDISCTLITSVNKMGMDKGDGGQMKSNIRGSGQQIHDADVIFMLTKFSPIEGDADDMTIKPADYDKFATLHIAAGRELDEHVPGGCIHYKRDGSPFFTEWKDADACKPDKFLVENWQERADIGAD